MPKQRDAARPAVVAVIAVFKGIDTAQFNLAIIVTSQAEGGADHGFIEKLQTFVGTGALRRLDTDFTRLEAVQPEPDAGCHQSEYQ